jgi:flagellar protein FlaG
MAIPSIAVPVVSLETAKSASLAQTTHVVRSSTVGNTAASMPNTATDIQRAPSKQEIDQALEHMRAAVPPMARNLQFSLDSDTGETIVKVVDSSTNEVIRQIPSKELLALAKTLDEFTGMLLKQKA